jgi:adenylyltransferase/sulfurtransferase
VLVDVREPAEHAVASIEGSVLMPLRQLPRRWHELPRDRTIVVHCKSGGRSAIAVAALRLRGFDARNLSGGFRAWSRGEGR